MKNILRKVVCIILLPLFSGILFFGCKESVTEPEITGSIQDVNDYLTELPAWDMFSMIMEDTTATGVTDVDFDYPNGKIRITTPCSITRTPEKIVTYSPGSEILYIGSLIQGKSYLGGLGSMEELPIRQRAPVTLSIDLLFYDNFRVVENPNLAYVRQAIGELIFSADDAGHVAGSSIFFNQTTSHSVEQSTLNLGLSVKFLGAGIKASLNWEKTTESSTITAQFTQKMFTTSMVLPQRPADIFSDAFTPELLQEQVEFGRIGSDNLPVFVSSITWGRMMMLTMTSTYDEEKMKAALRASYSGMSASVDAEHLEILENSEIRVVTVGGDQSSALSLLRSGSLGDYFKNDAPLTTAVPISYTLRNLGDNTIAKVCETTSYDIVEYRPLEVQIIGSESEWRNAVLSAGFVICEWQTNSENISKAIEINVIPGENTPLGNRLTFLSDTTSFPFDFYLENTAVDDPWALVYADQEADGYKWDWISIGDTDDFENDDFEVGVTGSSVYAFAIDIGDNVFSSDEYVEIYGQDANTGQETFLKQFKASELKPFMGILSPIPLTKVMYNESTDGDDIFVQNFRFGILK
jgi:hypothetical protein